MTNEQHAFVAIYAALVAKYDGEADDDGRPAVSPTDLADAAMAYVDAIRNVLAPCVNVSGPGTRTTFIQMEPTEYKSSVLREGKA